MENIIILGAGIAGLGASYSLRQRNIKSIVFEKDKTYGGLAGNFSINGFRFDRFVHFSFSKDPQVNRIFNEGCNSIITHIPNPFNLYHGIWIKHPAQNNLFPLPDAEKEVLIADFKNRPNAENLVPSNYEQWLKLQYGNAFAEKFPMIYTRKYWMTEARDLETSWVGKRLYQPSLQEVLDGATSADTPMTYYTKEMRYPSHGGFKQFLSTLTIDADIRYNNEIVEIDWNAKTLKTQHGEIFKWSRIISSIPLPILTKITKDCPSIVRETAEKLKCTSGWQISIGLKTKNIPPYLWWYIYDEDILPARVYSPSLKSPDNVPEGCSSLQLEVYCNEDEYSQEDLIKKSIRPLINQNLIKEEDILFIDLRFEKWANVIFDHNILDARKIVRDWFASIGIETIGRFGEWDYLWSDQSLLSGLRVDSKIPFKS